MRERQPHLAGLRVIDLHVADLGIGERDRSEPSGLRQRKRERLILQHAPHVAVERDGRAGASQLRVMHHDARGCEHDEPPVFAIGELLGIRR